MAVDTFPSTLEGGFTPVCNRCATLLCWDISQEEYWLNKEFWDAWICKKCNGGTKFNYDVWRVNVTKR